MSITTYQIQNILKTYHKQLGINSKQKAAEDENDHVASQDKVQISAEGKRKFVKEHLANDAIIEFHKNAILESKKL